MSFDNDDFIKSLKASGLRVFVIDGTEGAEPSPTASEQSHPAAPNALFIPTDRAMFVHTSTNTRYLVDKTARDEESGDAMIVYISMEDADVWVRSAIEFFDGRFQPMNAGAVHLYKVYHHD